MGSLLHTYRGMIKMTSLSSKSNVGQLVGHSRRGNKEKTYVYGIYPASVIATLQRIETNRYSGGAMEDGCCLAVLALSPLI